jgi:hypothetical protein
MSSLVATTMSPEDMIFTFKQKSEESFKEAWSRIYDWHGKAEPKMTLSLLLSCFYFGLAFNRLNTLETRTDCLKNCYGTLRQHFDYVPINSEPSSWYPTVKITIGGETFHARCDIMSEFCLMPKDVYESLSL